MSERIADLLGATPVLTTASDVGKTIPVDILGRHLGWQVQAPRSTSPACRPMWSTASPLPWCKRRAAPLVDPAHAAARQCGMPHRVCAGAARPPQGRVVGHPCADVPDTLWSDWAERLVVYRPPMGQTADATTA